MRRKDKPIDQRLYLNMPPFLKLVTAEATAADQKEFVQILSSNSKFIDLHHICGYDMVAEARAKDPDEAFFLLKSGRAISSTATWNPVVFAFLFDHQDVIEFLRQHQNTYDFARLFQVHDFFSCDDDDQTYDQKQGLRNFLSLLIENFSTSLYVVLDAFYYLIDFDDLVYVLAEVAGIETAANS